MVAIALTSRIDKAEALSLARKLASEIIDVVDKLYVDASLKPHIGFKHSKIEFFDIESFGSLNVDIAVVIGGDGSILRLLHYFREKNPPYIFSINMGRYGFLSEISPENSMNLLREIIRENRRVEVVYKPRIVGYVGGRRLPPVLNDYVILAPRLKMVHLKLTKVRTGETVYNIYADGLIVSPTSGSTGYSLSAGGPVVDEDLSAIVATPMNPMQLRARSVVFSIDEELEVEVLDREVEVYSDGFLCCRIAEGERVRIVFWDRVGFFREKRQYYDKIMRRDHV